MPDVAQLGLAVDSSQVEKGTIALTGLSGAAAKAEAAAAGLKGSAQAAAASAQSLTGATQLEARSLDAATAAAKLNKMALDAQAVAARSAAMNAKQLSFQLIDVAQGIPLLFQSPVYGLQNLGFQVAQIGQLYMGRGGLTAAIKDSAGQANRFIGGVVTKMPLVTGAVVAASAAFAGMTYEINRTSDASVSFGNVVQASVQVAAESIEGMLKPVVDAIAPWFATAWDAVTSGVKLVGNTIINSFRAVFSDLTFIFTKFPDIVAAGIGGAANMVLSSIESMLNYASRGINSLIESVNAALAKADAVMPGNGFRLGTIDPVKLDRVDTGGAGNRLFDANKAHAADIADIMGSDPLGQYFDAVKSKAVELAKASKDAGKALKDAAAGAVDPWEGMREVSEGVKEQMRDLKRQSEATQRAWERFGDGATDIFSGLITHTMSWNEALASAIPLVKDLILNLMKAQSITGGGGGGLGSWLSSLFGGGTTSFASDILSGVRVGLFHDGRYPGNAGSTRMADPSWFVGAPRYHSGRIPGLKADEEPAILRRNEPVFRSMQHARDVVGANNNQQPAANQNGMDVNITVSIDENGNLQAFVQKTSRAEIKNSGVGSVAQHARNHAEAKRRSMIK